VIRRLMTSGLVAVLLYVGAADLLACGDKFLVPSRGRRFELTPAARQQAAVLLYVNPQSPLPVMLTKLAVDPALRKAGYRPTVAASAAEFNRILRQGNWDVVLVDLLDSVAPELSDVVGSAVVLPVAVNPTNSDLTLARKKYATILKSPTRSQAFVDALDVAVTAQRAARVKAAKKSL
jgi:hypothetical protein